MNKFNKLQVEAESKQSKLNEINDIRRGKNVILSNLVEHFLSSNHTLFIHCKLSCIFNVSF